MSNLIHAGNPQIFAGNRRKPQEPTENRRLALVPLGLSPQAQPHYLGVCFLTTSYRKENCKASLAISESSIWSALLARPSVRALACPNSGADKAVVSPCFPQEKSPWQAASNLLPALLPAPPFLPVLLQAISGFHPKLASVPADERQTPPLANPLIAERAFLASEYWGLTRVSEVHGKW